MYTARNNIEERRAESSLDPSAESSCTTEEFLDGHFVRASGAGLRGCSPPGWRQQLRVLLSADARGTVQEFHDFLRSLAGSENCEFTCLCAAILSAQTRDRAAIDATKRLLLRFGSACAACFSPAALALAPLEMLSECLGLAGVNFYKGKAQRLRETAATLLSHHAGRVPASFDALIVLPGVGPKIANLVLSVTFQQATGCGMVVDTHVQRVARRLGWSRFTEPEQTRHCLEGFVSEEIREIVARRMIGFGQEICKPRHPVCKTCPLAREDLCPSAQVPVERVLGATSRSWKLRPSNKRTIIELSVDT